MSFTLFARPIVEKPEPESFDQLKYVLARRYFDHDGSLRSGRILVGQGATAWLEGVRDGRGPAAEEAARMLEMLKSHPHGLEVWIGDEDDH